MGSILKNLNDIRNEKQVINLIDNSYVEINKVYNIERKYLKDIIEQNEVLKQTLESLDKLYDKYNIYLGIRKTWYKEYVIELLFGDSKQFYTVLDSFSQKFINKTQYTKQDKQLMKLLNLNPEVFNLDVVLNPYLETHTVELLLNNNLEMELLKNLGKPLEEVGVNSDKVNHYEFEKDGVKYVLVDNDDKTFVFELNKDYVITIKELKMNMLFNISGLYSELMTQEVNKISIVYTEFGTEIYNPETNKTIELDSLNREYLMRLFLEQNNVNKGGNI